MPADMLPTAAVTSEIAKAAGAGWVFGFGLSLAFWLGGYVVGGLLRYFRSASY